MQLGLQYGWGEALSEQNWRDERWKRGNSSPFDTTSSKYVLCLFMVAIMNNPASHTPPLIEGVACEVAITSVPVCCCALLIQSLSVWLDVLYIVLKHASLVGQPLPQWKDLGWCCYYPTHVQGVKLSLSLLLFSLVPSPLYTRVWEIKNGLVHQV